MNKWIILNNKFLFGNVECHFELIPNNGKWTDKDVIGGGLFIADTKSNILKLFGKSYDYGRCLANQVDSAEFHWRWDDWTIMFTEYDGKDFDKVNGMTIEQFDWVRNPIKEPNNPAKQPCRTNNPNNQNR